MAHRKPYPVFAEEMHSVLTLTERNLAIGWRTYRTEFHPLYEWWVKRSKDPWHDPTKKLMGLYRRFILSDISRAQQIYAVFASRKLLADVSNPHIGFLSEAVRRHGGINVG